MRPPSLVFPRLFFCENSEVFVSRICSAVFCGRPPCLTCCLADSPMLSFPLTSQIRGFFPHTNDSLTPAECPSIQVRSDTIYLQVVWIPWVKSSDSRDGTCDTQHQLQMILCISDQPATNRGSHNLLLGELRKTLPYTYLSIT